MFSIKFYRENKFARHFENTRYWPFSKDLIKVEFSKKMPSDEYFSQTHIIAVFEKISKIVFFEKTKFFEKIHRFETFRKTFVRWVFEKMSTSTGVCEKRVWSRKKFLYKNFEIVSPYVSLSNMIFQRLIPVVLMTEQQLDTR